MAFSVTHRGFLDKSLERLVINAFDFFYEENKEKMKKTHRKFEEVHWYYSEVCNYVESGLKKKISENIGVLATFNPYYAIKYERGYLLGLQSDKFDILVFKAPYICVPGKFLKRKEDMTKANVYLTDHSSIFSTKLFKLVTPPLTSSTYKRKNGIKALTEDYFHELLSSNLSYYYITTQSQDSSDLSKLSLAIQFDLSQEEADYNWNVLIGKHVIYSDVFPSSCEAFFHFKAVEAIGELGIRELQDIEIVIFKKTAVFESILKNILTGKLQEIEIKHFIILLSVIVFLILVIGCRKDYSSLPSEQLSWFDENVCKNKNSAIIGMAFIFLFSVVYSFLKKKFKK